MANELNRGWGWPGNSRKAHYFRAGDSVSACARWMFTGPREPVGESSKDDCATCTRELAKDDGAA